MDVHKHQLCGLFISMQLMPFNVILQWRHKKSGNFGCRTDFKPTLPTKNKDYKMHGCKMYISREGKRDVKTSIV